jgi:hypothetical protein
MDLLQSMEIPTKKRELGSTLYDVVLLEEYSKEALCLFDAEFPSSPCSFT